MSVKSTVCTLMVFLCALAVVGAAIAQELGLPPHPKGTPPPPPPMVNLEMHNMATNNGTLETGIVASQLEPQANLVAGWNYGICYFSQSAGGFYYFWLYSSNLSTLIGQFFSNRTLDAIFAAAYCGTAHWVGVYCPDASCSGWTQVQGYPYGYYYPGY